MNLLITGATGFLGWNLARWFSRKGGHVVGSRHHQSPVDDCCAEWIHLDLSNEKESLTGIPDSCDAVIHCAAMASANACEEKGDEAYRVNVGATALLAMAASERQIPFVFISTDLVFDGTRAPYSEDDPTAPATWYGETKALAEQRVCSIADNYYILRTALMYGMHGPEPGSFLRWTVDGLREGTQLGLYTNQFRNPLFAPDVARCIHALLARGAPSGTYHLGGPKRLSRYDIGLEAARILVGRTDGIVPALLQRDPKLGPGDDTTLLTDRIRHTTGISFTTLNHGLSQLRRDIHL